MRSLLLIAVAMTTPAMAQDRLRFCPNRPSLSDTPCTTEPGHVQVEVSATDWTVSKKPGMREDTVLLGDMQVRLGIAQRSELQLAWSPLGMVRARGEATGSKKQWGTGDVTIGWRQNLRHPAGSGFSVAIQPQVQLPTGTGPLSAGTWGAGVVVPVNIDLSNHLALLVTSEAAALPNEDGDKRHFALTEIFGLGFEANERLTLVGEVQIERDRDPADHQTRLFAAGSVAWQPEPSLQFDVLVGAGLNRSADDLRILAGGAFGF